MEHKGILLSSLCNHMDQLETTNILRLFQRETLNTRSLRQLLLGLCLHADSRHYSATLHCSAPPTWSAMFFICTYFPFGSTLMICTQPVAEEEMFASFTLCVSACWGFGRMGEGVPPVVAGLLRNLMRNLKGDAESERTALNPHSNTK